MDNAWQPVVGDRVRVRLVPGRICEEEPHFAEEDGAVGEVVRTIPTASAPTHPYFVRFQPAVVVPNRLIEIAVRHYRADELEPA